MNIFRKQLEESTNFELELDSVKTELKDVLAAFETLKEDNIRLSEELNTIREQLASKTDEVEQLEETVEELEETLEDKQEEIEEVLENTVTVEKRAAVKALEILADSGCDPLETIEGPDAIDPMEQLKKLKGKELVDFYNEHKKEILSQLKK